MSQTTTLVGFCTKKNPGKNRIAELGTGDWKEAIKTVNEEYSCVRTLALIIGGKTKPKPSNIFPSPYNNKGVA